MRLLAILPFSPAAAHGGAAILRSVLADWPGGELGWHDMFGRGPVATGPGEQSASPWAFSALAARRLRRIRSLAPALIGRAETQLLVPGLARRVRAFQPDCILIYAHSAMMHIYEALLDRVQVPFHITVHDCPIIHMDMPSAPPADKAHITAQFGRLYRAAASRDVISERMRRSYQERFGADAAVVTKGIPRSVMPTGERALDGDINIVMGGAGFTDDLWPGEVDPIVRFFDALEAFNATGAGPRLKFHTFDKTFADAGPGIEAVPWLPQVDYDRFLERMHLGYAYDMLTPVGRRFAAMSFPTKIVNYICQGLPFIYHGPADSTVADLLREHPCGVLVDSLDAAPITAAIGEALHRYDEMQAACQRAALALYDRHEINARFRAALTGTMPTPAPKVPVNA